MKEREQQSSQDATQQDTQQTQATSQFQEGQTATNGQGQKIVFTNGQWVAANG